MNGNNGINHAPGLFGVKNSNRDFSLAKNWGKNQFNNAFPAALAAYMSSKKLEPVYLTLDENMGICHGNISVTKLFGIDPLSQEIFYAFESIFTPFEIFAADSLPRIDLVVCRVLDGRTVPTRSLEVKMTALPDNQTAMLSEDKYGSEIVVRPDTIVYLAYQIATNYADSRDILRGKLELLAREIHDWKNANRVLSNIKLACDAIDDVVKEKVQQQEPLLIQPIWKTDGKKLFLTDDCLDVFVWSDFAVTRLFVDVARANESDVITRHMRCVIWLAKMLYDFAMTGKINHEVVIDSLTYETKNDKAFSVSGMITRKYLASDQLTKPRIKKAEIKEIILGGGEKLLSPERRFDAALLTTPGLF